jgi:hypothetical protein
MPYISQTCSAIHSEVVLRNWCNYICYFILGTFSGSRVKYMSLQLLPEIKITAKIQGSRRPKFLAAYSVIILLMYSVVEFSAVRAALLC